jgi:hypothetical protein
MNDTPRNPDTVELAPIPVPSVFESDMDRPVPFDAGTTVLLDCPDPAAAPWLERHFADWFGAQSPRIAPAAGGASSQGEPTESYSISADSSGVRVSARILAGVRWAAYSLRQLAIARRGTMRTEGRILPALRISDSPRLPFRAVHLCWFPETRPEKIERAIRLAALLKFNCAILEPWGAFRSARHPWYGWPDAPATPEEFARLAAIGRDLGVTLVPQLNVFGHASLSRSSLLKHAALDLRPEYEPLFEPGGWNWCLSNPEARRVLRELVDELHEACGRPPFFHLGCDEAQPPSCPECRRRPYGELVREHVAELAAFVRERGARAMVWHDMLLDRADPRWAGFIASGSPATATLADTLPRDVVVCDWQYADPDPKRPRDDWPTLAHLLGKGFDVAGCTWLNFAAMEPMADFLASHGGLGLVATTWHHLQGTDWRDMFRTAACAAWGTPPPPAAPQFDTAFAVALRLAGLDAGVSDYRDTGLDELQIPPA